MARVSSPPASSPARDEHGALDPADVTADLVEIHQNATAAALADRLVAGP